MGACAAEPAVVEVVAVLLFIKLSTVVPSLDLFRRIELVALRTALVRVGTAFRAHVVAAAIKAVPDALRDPLVESAAGVASVEVIGVGAFLAVDCRSPLEGVPLRAGLRLGVEGLGLGEDGDWGSLGLTNA